MLDLSVDQIVLFVAVPVGLLTIKKNDPLHLKLFPFFLLLTLSVELVGQQFRLKGQNNVWLYNFYSVVEFVFYTYFFRTVIPGKKIKKALNYVLYILPLICLSNIFFIQGIMVFHTYTYSLASLTMVTLGVIYFFKLFNDTREYSLLRDPSFWMGIAIVFFFISSISVIGVLNYVSTLPRNVSMLLQAIFLWLNAFYYLLFIIAFLCKTNILKSSHSS